MRPAVVSVCALAAGLGAFAAWRVLSTAKPSASEGALLVRVDVLARPAGVSGGALDVAAWGDVSATAWEDGSVTVRAEGRVERTPPPSPEERFRRVAVGPEAAVTAITTRGRLFAVEGSSARDLRARVESGSRIAAGPATDDLWTAGETGAVRRVSRATGVAQESWESGGAPFTALAVRGERVWAGDVTGGVLGLATSKEDPVRFTTPSRVIALDARDGWTAVAGEKGDVVARADADGALVSVHALRAAFGVRLLPGGPARPGAAPPLLVVHEPASATVFEESLFDRRHEFPLGSKPRAACALADEGSLLVATDDGEVVVRVELNGTRR